MVKTRSLVYLLGAGLLLNSATGLCAKQEQEKVHEGDYSIPYTVTEGGQDFENNTNIEVEALPEPGVGNQITLTKNSNPDNFGGFNNVHQYMAKFANPQTCEITSAQYKNNDGIMQDMSFAVGQVCASIKHYAGLKTSDR